MRCPKCQNLEFKIMKRKYIIKTRLTTNNEFFIENLPVKECKICAYTFIPESSEKYINLVREKIISNMTKKIESDIEVNKKDENSYQNLNNLNLGKIKDKIKQIIS